MSKRKPLTRVDKILPDDAHLGQRNAAWRALMNKYTKCDEGGAIDVKDYLDAVERRAEAGDDDSDSGSDASEVITDDEPESDAESREEIRNQLRRAVDERMPVWKKTGLQQQMAELELPSLEGNLLSRKKVEDWLFNRPFKAGAAGTRRMSQHEEIIMSEQNEDGKQTKIQQHMQYVSMTSENGDDDSLQSVDTASYILASRQQQSSVTNRVTIIKKFTKTVEFKAMPPLDENAPLPVTSGSRSDSAPPPVASVSGKASRLEVPPPAASGSRKACKSDSNLEKKDTKSKSSRGRRNASESPRKREKPAKTQKKSFKKKAAPVNRKQSDKPPKQNAAEQYAEAVRNGAKVKKVTTTRTYRPAPKRNEWHVSDKSSSGEDNDDVFTKPKPEPKTPPRKKPSSRNIKFTSPSTLNIVGSFEAINLVTPEKIKTPPQQTTKVPDKPLPIVDQTSNMTALFSDANEKIVNSTEIGVASTSLLSGVSASGQSRSNSTKSTKSSNRSERFPGYPEDRAVFVYKPKQITEDNRKVRIYGHQMDLSQVTRARHLQKFQTFSCVIHSNSSIVFYPSDSEDELPANSTSDEDSDDPLSNYHKRDAPLRVVERGYRKGPEGR